MKAIEAILLVVGLLFLYALILAFPTMVLWNWLMPTIFNLPTIGFWQACGINLLASILFKPTINIKQN